MAHALISRIFRALVLLAAALAISVLAPSTALADLGNGTIETYDELARACSGESGTYTLAADITYDDDYPSVYATITIDLNGKTIDANGESYAFFVSRGSLTITGSGTIKGASNYGIYISGGSFTMGGGTISGNKDGVDVSRGSFNMTGGTISGNREAGVEVTGGTFTMNGGAISGNKYGVIGADGEAFINGGQIIGSIVDGIWINGCTLHVSGGTISGNGASAIQCYTSGQLLLSGSPVISGRIYLNKFGPMAIEGSLTLSSALSVLWEPSDGTYTGVFTSGFSEKCGADADPTQYFTAAASGYAVVKSSDGKEAAIAKTYAVTCTAVDTSGNGTDATVSASPNPALPGETVTVTVTPAGHYSLQGFEVKQGDTAVAATQTGDNPITYTFTMPAGDVTATATFIGEIVSFSYEIIKGTWSDGSITAIPGFAPNGSLPTDVPQGMIPIIGYHGSGWAPDPSTTRVAQGAVYTYICSPNEYWVRFSAGAEGVVGNMDDQLLEYGSPVSLTTCAFTREGYTFAGWKDAAGNTYTDGEAVVNLSEIQGDVVVLTAMWQGNPAKITFDLDGGTLEGQTGTYVLDAHVGDVIILKAPTRTNFAFEYWQGSEYYAGDEYTVTGDHTLKAVWQKVIPETGDGAAAGLVACAFAAAAALATLVFARRRGRDSWSG
ncbi:MAG: InlB B-repeat-containing protein [Eggerthellaceae bacterium]|nr:InlB B-repeat-containing protein [Eggerthellaceae bacterium]